MRAALRLNRAVSAIRRMATAEDHGSPVHFHQGPQGQPTPCFESDCPNPRLSV